MTDLDTCRILDLPAFDDPGKGVLSVAEGGEYLPFEIRRAYWIYRVPYGETRGGHAHKNLSQVLIAVSGSLEVTLDNGNDTRRVLLNNPAEGLLLFPGIWRTLENFSNDAVCLCLASELYDEQDYIRDYDEFLEAVLKNED